MALPYIPGLTEVGDMLGFGDAGSEEQKKALEAWDELGRDPAAGPGRRREDEIYKWANQRVQAGDMTGQEYRDVLEGRVDPRSLGFRPDRDDENLYLDRFQTGDPLSLSGERFVDPGTSSWQGTKAHMPGASRWDELEALDAGDSAWGGIDWDRAGAGAQRAGMDYVGGELASDSVGRRTAAAESEWERQRQVADQQARAHREAGMRDLEMRGQAGGGAALGATLAGEQDRSMSRHGAGLDFLSIVDSLEAQERGRRDQLAATGAGIGSAYDASQFGQAGAQAQGQDAWSAWTAQMEDSFRRDQAREQDRREQQRADARAQHQRDQAAGLDSFGLARTGMEQDYETRDADRRNVAETTNYERDIGVLDANTSLGHVEEERRAGLPGTRFDRRTTVAAGKSGQHQAGADAKRDASGRLLNTAAGAIKGVAAAKGG
jgi:hypothetical protein